jgi:hypothetical protein
MNLPVLYLTLPVRVISLSNLGFELVTLVQVGQIFLQQTPEVAIRLTWKPASSSAERVAFYQHHPQAKA